MRVIITGSRTYEGSIEDVQKIVDKSGFEVDTVLCGGARGADDAGFKWAWKNRIPIENHPANWKKFGKIAGLIRNEGMVKKADALIAIWNGKSSGTEHVIKKANESGLKVFIEYFLKGEKK